MINIYRTIAREGQDRIQGGKMQQLASLLLRAGSEWQWRRRRLSWPLFLKEGRYFFGHDGAYSSRTKVVVLVSILGEQCFDVFGITSTYPQAVSDLNQCLPY